MVIFFFLMYSIHLGASSGQFIPPNGRGEREVPLSGVVRLICCRKWDLTNTYTPTGRWRTDTTIQPSGRGLVYRLLLKGEYISRERDDLLLLIGIQDADSSSVTVPVGRHYEVRLSFFFIRLRIRIFISVWVSQRKKPKCLF